MTWRRYLQIKTREPAFLWRLSIGIVAVGIAVGLAVDWAVPAPVEEAAMPSPGPRDDGRVSELQRLADQFEWAKLWWAIPGRLMMLWMRAPALTALAVLTGLAWLAFWLQAAQIRCWKDYRLWAPLASVALGVLSIWPTFFFIYWQERAWGLVESAELIGGLRFFILGVGLREEFSKLLCVMPLLPFLVWRRDELAALVCAPCVGVGFGMGENVQYISSSAGAATMTRLLMPMPFHMAATGLIGLAAYRACLWPRDWGPQFLAVFGSLVVAHGMYDAFGNVTALADYSMATFVIFVLLVFQLFRELRPLHTRRGEPISLTANFLACVCLVAGANFIYLCAAVGWRDAGNMLAQSILAQGVMIYLFLREMPDRVG